VSFANDIRSGRKPNGKLFAYIEGMPITALPRTSRETQTFAHCEQNLQRLTTSSIERFLRGLRNKDPRLPKQRQRDQKERLEAQQRQQEEQKRFKAERLQQAERKVVKVQQRERDEQERLKTQQRPFSCLFRVF